ncbi:MAG: hypothetical protein K5650_03240 [Bacteroidales bacterium]|nr:hypothetical protein [Bacteroidales bacterium]
MDRLFNYNLYEHARWGAGLRYIYSLDGSPAGRQLWVDAYGGYGVADQAFKYGGALSFKNGGNGQMRVGLSYVDDLERAASRNLEGYSLTNLSANSVYMATRFSHIRRATASVQGRVAPRWTASANLRYSVEEYLFTQTGMVYPTLNGGNHLPLRRFAELAATADRSGTFKLFLLAGLTNLPYSSTLNENGQLIENNVFFIRGIAQYSKTVAVGSKGQFDLFGQLGASNAEAPYSRIFDLGGTWGSAFYFSHALLTLRPAELAANCYAQLCLRLATVKPLWNLGGYSAPKVYAQVNGVIGALWDGGRLAEATYTDGLTLYAPTKGLLEFSAGVSNLLTLSGISIGFAAAWQVAPESAVYYRSNPADRLALLSSATLLF